MTRTPINLVPAITLAAISLLFAVTWSHDQGIARTCAQRAIREVVEAQSADRTPALIAKAAHEAPLIAIEPPLVRAVAWRSRDLVTSSLEQPVPAIQPAYRDWLAPLLKSDRYRAPAGR